MSNFILKVNTDGTNSTIYKNYNQENREHLTIPTEIADKWSTKEPDIMLVWDTHKYEIYLFVNPYEGDNMWTDCKDYEFKNKGE